MTSRERAYDEVLESTLPAGLVVVAVLFGVFAVWHPLALPGAAGPVMGALAATTAVAALVGARATQRRRLSPGRHHLLGSGLALLALSNCAVQYAFTQQPFLVVNVILVVVATGICLVDPRWVAGTVALSVVAFLATVQVVAGLPPALAAVPNCALAVGMAVLANATRVGALRRLLAVQADLRALSQRDDLTGLLNRRGFLQQAQSRLDGRRPVRVWFVDVDGLKQVNDVHGHDVGDLLLVSVGAALDDVFDDGVVARLSGDEFAVVEGRPADGSDAPVRARLAARLALAEHVLGLPVSVSAGWSTSGRGQDLSSLLAAADAAMYREKQRRDRVGDPCAGRVALPG